MNKFLTVYPRPSRTVNYNVSASRTPQPTRQAQRTRTPGPGSKTVVVELPKPKPKKAKKVMVTRGRMEGKMLPKKKPQGLNYQRAGIVHRIESGGVVQSNDSVYIGHSTVAQRQVVRDVFRTVVKKLHSKAGLEYNNFEEPMATIGGVTVRYTGTLRLAETGAPWQEYSLNVLTNTTFSNHALQIQSAIATLINQDRAYEFGKIFMYAEATTAADYHPLASMDLGQTLLDFDLSSTLKIQNTTAASIGSTDARTDADNVSHNPLQGKAYDNPYKWANHLEYKSGRPGTALATPVLLADGVSGVISFTSAASSTSELAKPPLKPWQFGCSRSTKVILSPGGIRTHNLRFKATLSFNTFCQKFAHALNVLSAASERVAFGNAAVVGLEKSLASRTEGPEPVRVAYQLDQIIRIACKNMKRQPTAELIEIL